MSLPIFLHGVARGSQLRMPVRRSFYPRPLLGRFIDFLEANQLVDQLANVTTVAEELWLPSYIIVHEQNWMSRLREQQTFPTAITTHLRLGICPTCPAVHDMILGISAPADLGKGSAR